MKTIEVYVYTSEGLTPKRIQLDPEALVEEIVRALHPGGTAEEVVILVENEREPLDQSRKIADCGIKENHFLHCHRCRRLSVSVAYNGTSIHGEFAPSTTVERVLKWTLREFKLKGHDAEDKVLRVDAKSEPLAPEAHIGSMVKGHHCSLGLYLTALVLVEG